MVTAFQIMPVAHGSQRLFPVLIFGAINASAMCYLSGVPSVVNLVAFRVYNKWFKSDTNPVPFCAFATLIVAQSRPSAGAV